MPTVSSRIATTALTQFDLLPPKSKPRVHANGTREWTPLSAIILAEGIESDDEVLTCVSLATGTKCLPVSSIPKCQGTVLHDSHAEVLALRAFNRFLLKEIERVVKGEGHVSRWVEPQYHTTPSSSSHAKPFILRPSVSIHMFSTEAPCGDASMGLLINSKPQGDAESWPEPMNGNAQAQLHGRGYFSILGAVRRKPSRGDAEPSLSKSCTDKLAVKQGMSLLAFPACLLVERTENAYLKSLVLPEDKFDAEGSARAFGAGGRLAERVMPGSTLPRPAMHHFQVDSLPPNSWRFAFAKLPSTAEAPKSKASNISALWARGLDNEEPLINETLVNGVRQGSKQFSEASFKRSAVCRNRMWQQGRELVSLLRQSQEATRIDGGMLDVLEERLSAPTYKDAKGGTLDQDRAAAKQYVVEVLGGWQRNQGDEKWLL